MAEKVSEEVIKIIFDYLPAGAYSDSDFDVLCSVIDDLANTIIINTKSISDD